MQIGYRLYPLIALTLIAGASVWLERVTRVDEVSGDVAAQTGPDFTAENTRIVGYGPTGSERYELIAERLSHYPANDVTHLENPRLRMRSEDSETNITAVQAEVSSGGERVDLSGDVRVRRPAGAGGEPLALDSATLTVWPDSHRAQTDSPVVLTRGTTRADALGMRADNLFGTLDLIGEVRVHMPSRQGKS